MTLETIRIAPENNRPPEFTMVILHGWGANNQDLTALTPMLGLPQGLYLFPNAPYAHPDVAGGRAWYALENNNQGIENSLDTFYTLIIIF